jgi:hemerythrin superfamily protein
MEGASSMAPHIHANDDETRHQPDDAITLLTADHRQVRALFQQYAHTPDPYLKQIIAEHVFAELTLHMLLEETVFYPAVAEQADEEGKQLIDEALQDHQEVKALLETLQETDDDTAFEAGFQALRALVEQHIEDEETRIFPEAAQVLAPHWEEITILLQERKEQILASYPFDIASEGEPWDD